MKRMICWMTILAVCSPLLADDAPPTPQRVFQEKHAEWVQLLKELQQLQEEYRAAEDDEQRRAIAERFETTIERGDQLQPQLIDAAEDAYAADPDAADGPREVLRDVLRAEIATDNYDEALRIGKLLVSNGDDSSSVLEQTGVAAFAVSRFDEAEKYFEQAGRLTRQGEMMAAEIPDQKKKWAREKKLREQQAAADDLPRVLLKTDVGEITIELFEEEAPIAVANFISLVEKGYYDGITFHRVLPGFMAQGGCPDGTGTGGPGYNIPGEAHKPDARMHFRGSLSMALGPGGPDTGGSQFFLTFLPTTHLDGRHTVFGRVIEGMDVLPKIQRRDPQAPNPPKPSRIIKAEVLRKRDHKYEPTKVEQPE